MEKKLINHHNLIGHDINESLENYANDIFDREVYCREFHAVKAPLQKDCRKCPYFAGYDQGHGFECEWEDVVKPGYVVQHEDRYKEYERVDKLIKLEELPSFENDTVARVKDLSYDENVWIYKQSEDRKYRFALGKKGKKSLICFGVNPSTASPEDLDPTLKIVESMAIKHGYDGYIMFNLYPMRATDPNYMDKRVNEEAAKENLKVIEKILVTGKYDIWAAWGTLIVKRNYLSDCLQRIEAITDRCGCQWYTMGEKSKDGHPHHPLYLKKDSKMDKFDINKYLSNLK